MMASKTALFKVCLHKDRENTLSKKTEKQKITLLLDKTKEETGVCPQDAIIRHITHPDNRTANYPTPEKVFTEKFPEFSFEDIISFMAAICPVSLQDDCVLPIKYGEILS